VNDGGPVLASESSKLHLKITRKNIHLSNSITHSFSVEAHNAALVAFRCAIFVMEPPPYPAEGYCLLISPNTSLLNIASMITSFFWEMLLTVSSVLLRLVPVASWLTIYLLQDLCLALAYILRMFARHAEDVALFLEAAKGRASDGSMRPPAQALTAHMGLHGSEEDDTVETSIHDVSRPIGVGARSDAMGGRPPSSVKTKREAGLDRIRELHEWRRRRGLKV
jgi:hypothetical protein